MRILFTRFPLESRMGGAEIQTLSLMKGLISRGHTVEFLGSCPVLLRASEEIRVKSEELHIGNPPVTKFGVMSFLWRKSAMKRKLLSSLFSHHSSLDGIVMLSLSEKLLLTEEAVRRGIKVIWVEHDPVGRWLSKNPWLSTLTSLSQKVTVVVVSDLSKKIYEGLGFKNVVVIPNGIDFKRFEKNNSAFSFQHSSLRIGCVARLAEEKGVDVLLEAMRELPQVSLAIVGDGPEESFIRNFISDITVREGMSEPRIQLLSHVDDLGAFYQSLDVFVLPSRTNDPFGLVAAEAMSLGIATVVTDACGIAGFLTSGSDALVVPAEDSGALQKAISSLMEESVRHPIAKQGQTTAHEKFSVEKMVQKYETILGK